MRVRFLINGGSDIDLDNVEADRVIGLIKKDACTKVNVAWDEQRWVYKGKVLADSDTLGGIGFTDGDAIHLLKGARATAVPPPPQIGSGRFVPVPLFDAAMRSLLAQNVDEGSIKNCLLTVSKVLTNIINRPLEEKYRKLKISNALVQQKILLVPGSTDLLVALGFVLVGEEYILYSSSAAWDNIVACHAKLQTFLNKLESGVHTDIHPPAPAARPSGEWRHCPPVLGTFVANMDIAYSW